MSLKITGLNTSTNDFRAPAGALQVAKNIVINTPNVAEPRKGFERFGGAIGSSLSRADTILKFKDKVCIVTGGSLYYQDSGWNRLGSVVNTTVPRPAFANGNLYLSAGAGVKKWDALSSINLSLYAGVPLAETLDASVTVSGSGFLTSGDSVAYRLVWGKTDANDNLILGAPSSRVIATASGGTCEVDLDFSVPNEIANNPGENWVYRIYRSVAVSTGTPNDELQLAIEGEYTSGTSVSVTDTLDEGSLGAFIYTAASQEGLAASNYRPPGCTDIALFNNTMFFANTTERDQITVTLNDVNNLAVNDTLVFTIGLGVLTFTAKAAENAAAGEFKVFTTGTTQQNTIDTAKSLARVINGNIANNIIATYLGNEASNTNLGDIQIIGDYFSGATIYVTASNTLPWLPATIDTSGTDTASTNNARPHGLMWSKPSEPEAVPLTNRTVVGSKDSEIQRIIALDEAIIIFKEDGIYRLTGFYPDYEIELMDASIQLVGNNTPAVLSNEIYCLTNQGVAIVSANNVRIISTPIENDIFELFDKQLSNISTYSFGVGREDKRRYYLWYPATSSDTNATNCYVYNLYTKTWTTHDIPATCAFAVNGEFYYGEASAEYIRQERSTGTNRDYADYGFTDTITAISDLTITLDSNVDNVSVGDILYQGTTVYSPITAVDVFNSQVTVAADPGFTAASVDVLTSIPTEIKWLPNALGRPEINKQVHTATPLFKAGFIGDATLDFSTDISPGTESVTLAGTSLLGWGLTGWGSTPWGDTPDRRPFRQWLPRSKQRANWYTIGIRHSYGFSGWKLQGIRLLGDFGDEKTGK